MHNVTLEHQVDFATWRDAARRLAGVDVPPHKVSWSVGQPDHFFAALGDPALPDLDAAKPLTVPRSFLALAELVIRARDPERFSLLYTILWRMVHGEKHLLDIAADPQVQRARMLVKSVNKDMHKMRAFLRFREVVQDGRTQYVAWFEPEHYIVESNAGFFQRRFTNMDWFILTPYRSLHWDGQSLMMAEGATRDLLPQDDAFEAYWNTYFASTFNPVRLKLKTMATHMPRKYWKNMPETTLIPGLTREAATRTQAMIEAGGDRDQSGT